MLFQSFQNHSIQKARESKLSQNDVYEKFYALPSDISTALNAAALKTVFDDNIFMTENDNELSTISFDEIAVLNTEIKPVGHTSLQKNKDIVKAHTNAKRSINNLLKKKGGPSKAIVLLNMVKLLQDILFMASMPLIESNITHFLALKEQLIDICTDFKQRSKQFMPPFQISENSN
ncbi:8669_t:CDS:2 [Entrophospora sp. SA101]|nr:8956_t:CDS:2 [Entrophospora sp. SA101]CAJ0761064.1 8669_t:CDS:2 [Entrophospora sp. SA101]